MGVCAVYLDAAYLEKVLQREHPGSAMDYAKLAAAMAGSDELLRAYYYHCLPFLSRPPTLEEQTRFDRRHRFFSALRHLPRFEVRLGILVKEGFNGQGRPLFRQKRVDLMLGVDMALLAAKGRITSVALFSGDSDTIPAVEAVKQQAVSVRLWHGALTGRNPPSRDLYELCDERVELTGALMGSLVRD